MSLTIDLPKELEATLASQARAAHMPTERYLTQLIEHALKRQRRQAAENLAQHLSQMGSQVLPDTTPEEMEAALEAALIEVRPQRSWYPVAHETTRNRAEA
jgi:hypothetical protein